MDRALIKASHHLSELDIRIRMHGFLIRVCWFRVMFKDSDWFIRRHAHSTYEFHFVAAGECEVIHDSGAFRVGAGSFFLTGPDVYHTQRPAGPGELVEYSLNCDITPGGAQAEPDGEIPWLVSVLRNAPCEATADRHGAIALFESALREADQRLPGFVITVRSLVPIILVAAARSLRVSLPRAAEVAREPAGIEDRVARIERYVTENIGRELTPGDLADFVNLSERQLGRIVMHYRGYSTKKLITRIKLRRAKALLESTDMTLRAIAEELGFSSEFYFSSVFRKHEGFPPGEFRKSVQGR